MRPFLLLTALLLPHLAAAASPSPATLRPMTTLSASVVRLSDLFDSAGTQADLVLGPGPAPGTRIVVEAPQLAAIASQFGVDWHPASSADRAILERPGRPLPREDVVEALRGALLGNGASPDCDVDLQGFSPPLVASDANPRTAVEQLDQDPTSGRFTAVVTVFSDGLPPQRLRVAGRVTTTIEVPVATRRLLPGTLIRPTDLHVARIHANTLVTEVATSPDQVAGEVLRHLILPGQPFPTADLARQAMVTKNATVRMALSSPGLELVGQGVALEAGAMGDQISVLNPTSHMVMQARIDGPDSVRVAPGATAVPLGSRGPAPQVAER